MDDFQVPKGLTVIDPSKAPSGADASGVKVPKGLSLVGGEQPKAEQKPSPQNNPSGIDASAQRAAKLVESLNHPKNVPAGLQVQPKPSPFEGQTHVVPQPTMEAYKPTLWDRARRIPVNFSLKAGDPLTVGDISDEIHKVGRGVAEWARNPVGMTDAEWEQNKKRQQLFIESNLGKGALAGGVTGLAEFGEEFTSPTQIALMAGTFGESALVRVASKLEVAGAVPAARTLAKLVQAQFITQMMEGAVSGTEQTWKNIQNGDWESAAKSGVESLASAAMAKGLVSHEEAVDRVRTDLEKVAREKYGPSSEHPFLGALTNRFDQLDPFKQAAVIHETVQRTPEYKAVVEGVQAQDEEAKAKAEKQQAKKLAYYQQEAINQTWSPNAVTRTIRRIDEHRRSNAAKDSQKEATETARSHYLKQITKLIDLHKQDRADEAELAAAEEERRASGREDRPARKTESAQKREEQRKVTLTNAAQIAEHRQGVVEARESADRETADQERAEAEKPATSQEVTRQPDEVTDDQGYVSYRGQVFGGEEHNFGTAQDSNGNWGVYRKTPDGIQFLGAGGIFEDVPEQPFIAQGEEAAKTLAQITSLRVNADYALEEHGSTPEREAERTQLRNLERQLVDGEVTAEQARKSAGLPAEAAEAESNKAVNHEIEAARAGVLNGPLHDRTKSQYEDDYLAGLEEAGWSPEDIESAIDTMGVGLRMEAENNLHYVGRSGDWITSKKGTTWVLDSKGMLQPDDGLSAPIPLLKNGRYSTQALDLATSGRVGFGQRSWEDAKVEDQREREANQQLDNLAQNVADELENAINLSKQNAGLKIEAGELPVERPAPTKRSRFAPPVEGQMGESPERETDRAVEEGYAASQTEAKALDEVWINAIGDYIGENHTSAWDLIQQVAKNSGMTPQEVLAIQVERMSPPNTLEGKIERLKAGDTISDKMGLPWVVKADKNGTLYLRKGQGARVHINKFKPSDDVRRIVGTGEVQPAPGPRYTPEDVRMAAFEAPYIARRQQAIEEVKDRAENPPAPPRTPEQAAAQAVAAQERAEEVKGAAIVETIKASDPAPGTSVEEAEKAVDKAEETVQTAEQAAWQSIEAKAKTVSEKPFPPRAPITMGPSYIGQEGVIKHLGQDHPFHYELVPDDQIVNSHVWDGNDLNVNEEYDEALQPRTISESRASELVLEAQLKASGGRGYDFDYFADKTLSPLTGPPILEKGGRNAGGNTRLALLRKHIETIRQISDPEERDLAMMGLRTRMSRLAREVGIPGRFPEDGRDYVVVRMLDEPITTRRDAATKGLVFNTSPSQDIGEAAKGVALAKQLTDSTLEDIGRMLDEHDTLGAAIAANPQVFTDIVTNELGVSSTEHPLWFNETSKGKVLSESGRRKFTQVLFGKILEDTSVMEALQGTPAYTSSERALINIVRMKATKNSPMVEKIVEAIHAAKQTWSTGIAGEGIADRWQATYDPKATSFDFAVTEAPPMPDKVVESFWRAMHAGPRTLSDRVKAYNETDRPSQGGMFAFEGEKNKLETPTELFNRVFAKELKEVNYQREGKRGEGITEAEYDAALENRGNLSDEAIADAKGESDKPEGQTTKYKYGNTQASIPADSEAAKALAAARNSIAPSDLAGSGLENEPHITVRYGIDGNDTAGIRSYLERQTPFEATLGKTETFPPSKSSNGAAPIIAPVEAADLHRMEKELDNHGEFIDRSFPEYKPHATLAYVKPEAAKKYTGMTETEGKKFTVKEVSISKKDGTTETVELKGKRSLEPPPAQAETTIAAAKAEKGYVTPIELHQFLADHPATADHAAEVMRTAKMMAEYVFDSDPPEGVDKKDALDWILKERVAKLAYEEKGKGRGSYSDPNIEKGIGTRILKLTKAADETTFIHEFAHVIFPMLSEEDMRAIDSITGEKGEYWKHGDPLRGEAYKTVSEKFAHGLEKFLRDENATGFSAEVKKVLAKVKEMFQQAYMRFRGDPLSQFNLSEEARQVFADMFHIEDFDVADDWRKQREAARKQDVKQKKGMVKPEEALHPVQQIAKDLGSKPLQILDSVEGTVEDASGDRVDPSKPTAVFVYPDEESGAAAYIKALEEGSGIAGVEFVASKDGQYAIRFNVKDKVPKSVLYQEAPQKHPGLKLELMEETLKKTTSPVLKRFLETQIAALKAEIRNEPKPEARPGLAKEAIAEVKRGRENQLRGVSDEPARTVEQARTGRLTKPPIMGMPGHAGARSASSGNRPGGGNVAPVNLANVAAVKLNPLPERGAPVGILAGEAFDEKAWRDGNKRAGLPENMPAPTVTLSPEVSRVLKYGGQKQIVQTILSALEQGDGAVIASSTGSGKTYSSGAVIKESLLKNPDAKILLITKNRSLLNDSAKVGRQSYGYEMEVDTPEKPIEKGVYGASYQRLLNNEIYAKTQWDLVIADESGEARNWHQESNQQGKLLKAVMDNAKKGVYVSATPFHSPMEYGYLDKLNLWPKGGFESWIKENFAHEKVGDKIIAKLDPAKQAKMRQQLIERGQMVSQEISYDGFSTHFGVVPVTDIVERKLDRIHQGITVMKRELLKQGKKGLAERVSAFEATYTKAYLERSRLPEAIQLAKRARAAGWQVVVFSETTSEDLFRRPVGPKEEAGTYRLLDEETGGQIGRIMPEFPNIMDELRSEFGDEIGDYSGTGNTDAQREEAKDAFLKGRKPILYTSYAAGGIGVSLHDEEGDKPRVSVFLGPPYSGVLLEQSLGRTWRFGVKSNARAVFLATDSEPDIRLMATKVGPRMRALRASVLGERDSLAAVMSNYTDEEKMREHQDMLAYSEQGNEVKVDAQGFQVRSKRKVNFDNWSSITFPNATEAMHKGMQVEMSGGGKGSDWATLYQEKPRRWEPPNRPLTIEDMRIRRAVNAAADKAAENPQIPHEEVTMTAVRAEEVAKEAPEGVDKEAAARDAVGGHLKGLGYVQDPLTGEWKTPEEIVPAEPATGPEEKYRAAMGMISSQEQNLINLDRQMNTGGAGRELVTKTRRYTAKVQRELADRRTDFTKIMQDNHLNPQDDKTMRDIFDVVMGKRAVADPAINKAAGQVSAMMAKIHQLGAEGKLSVRTPDGRMIPWSDFQDDASYMPRIADWNAKFTDAEGKTYTLKEIMGGTFGEVKAKELLAKKLREEGSSLTADKAYDLIKRERLRAPVQGNIHRTNEQNFPFIRKDYGALDNYFKQFSKAMATESEFGSDLRKLQKEIAKIPNKQARADVESMFGYMFTPQNWDTDLGRVYNTAAAMETATKMFPFSVTKVLFHAANAPLVMGGKMMPLMKAIGHIVTDRKAVRENGYYIGTVMHGVDPAVMYMPETHTQHLLFKLTGFEYMYNLGRTIAGESARVYLDQYAMHDLKKGGFQAENSRRLLKQTFLIGDHAIDEFVRTGKWTPEDYKLAQVAFTNESLYSENPMQMPGLSRQRVAGEGLSTNTKRLHMALRASYSLQSFSTKTYSMLREHLYDEVVLHYNMKPLAYMVFVAPIIGQMLQGTSAAAKGGAHRLAQFGMGKTHTEDAWDKWAAQFTGLKDKPAAAFLKLYIDGICSQWALERAKRLADALFNITIGDKASLKSAQAEGRYFLNDEIEQDIGPIWSDTVMRPIEFTGEEFEAAATSESQKLKGKPGSFLSRTGKNVVRNAEEMVPVLRQEPHVEEYLDTKKKTGKWMVP